MASISAIPFMVSGYIDSTTTTRTYNNPNSIYNNYPYEFEVELTVLPISNSTPSYQSDATDILAGQWLLQQSGCAYLIVSVVPTTNPQRATVTLRDVDLYNLYSDPAQSGINTPRVGQGTQNIIFSLSESGLANITYTSFMSGISGATNWLHDALGRLSYRNFIQTYYNFDINNQTHSDYATYSVGQVVFIGQIDGQGPYCFLPVDTNDITQVEKAFGIISSVNQPEVGNLYVRPFGKTITQLPFNVPGNPGDVLYYDPANPDGASYTTTIKPLINPIQLYIKISDNVVSVLNDNILRSGGGSGSDPRLDLYFLDPPPPATLFQSIGSTPTEIYASWRNPSQIIVGFTNQLLPQINVTTIQYRIPDISTSWITGYSGPFDSSCNSVIINSGPYQDPTTGNTRVIDGTTYTDMTMFYSDSNHTIDLKIFYSNYAGSSVITTLTGLSFLVGGPPSVPSIASLVPAITDAGFQATPGVYTDVSNALHYYDNGAPSLLSYTAQYTPISVAQRYEGIENITTQTKTTASISGASATPFSLTNLFPDTTYTLELNATNSLNLSSAYSPNTSMILLPPEPSYPFLDTAIVASPTTQYGTAYDGSGNLRTPVLYTDTASNVITVSNLSLLTKNARGDSSGNVCSVTGYVVTTGSSIVYPGFPANREATVSNMGDITFGTSGDTVDEASGPSSNFYLYSGFTYSIQSGLSARSSVYTMRLTQQVTHDVSGYYIHDVPFYVDSLLPGPPSFSAKTITNNSSITQVTGIPRVNTWSLNISSVQVSNSVYYFSASPVLTYTFANLSNQILVQYFAGTGAEINTLINSSGINVGSTAVALSYLPQITLTAKNINTTNSTETSSEAVPILLDPASITLANNLTVDSAPTGTFGHLMNSPDLSQTTSNDWTTAHTELDHSQDITGTNNLAIMNGYFTSSGYIPVISAYQDFTGIGGPNYQPLSSTGGYRWSTFRWTAPNGIASSLAFTIRGFTGTDIPTQQLVEPFLNNIKVFYRVEDITYNSGTPADPPSPPQGLGFYSTVWVNALYPSSNFSSLYATLSNTLTFGGLGSGANSISISGANITLSVLTPTATTKSLNIYLSVGLPMNNSIAFTHATCTAT